MTNDTNDNQTIDENSAILETLEWLHSASSSDESSGVMSDAELVEVLGDTNDNEKSPIFRDEREIAKQSLLEYSASNLIATYGTKPKPIIDKLLFKDHLFFLCAEKEAGKSTLMTTLAARVALGESCENLEVKESGCVIYVYPEAPQILGKTIRGVCKSLGKEMDLIDDRIFFVNSQKDPWATPDHKDHADKMNELIDKIKLATEKDVLLIVQDSLQASMGLEHSVNADLSARSVFDQPMAIKDKHHLCYAIVLHTNKNGSQYNGSQAWFAHADMFLYLKKEKGGRRFLGKNGSSKIANRHAISGWEKDGQFGLGYNSKNVGDGLIGLCDFERRACKKKPRKSQKPANNEPEYIRSRKDAAAYKVEQYALDNKLSEVRVAELPKIAEIPEKNQTINVKRIKDAVSRTGWVLNGDVFTVNWVDKNKKN